MSWGVGRRLFLDLALLWPWRRLAAVALIRLLAWEPTYAEDVALKKKKKKKRKHIHNDTLRDIRRDWRKHKDTQA